MKFDQATKRQSHEIPLNDLLIVLDVFDDQRAELPLGAVGGEIAPENKTWKALGDSQYQNCMSIIPSNFWNAKIILV